MVKIRKSGRFIRVRTYAGKGKPSTFRTQDLGSEGHTKRVAAMINNQWVTYGYIFPVADVKNRRPTTMKVLRNAGVTEADLRRIKT